MVSRRLNLLIRKNAGRLLRHEWENSLFTNLGLPSAQCRFLELEESDHVRERCEAVFLPRDKLDEQKPALNTFSEKQLPVDQLDTTTPLFPADSGNVYIEFLDSDKIGILLAPVAVINRFLKALVEFQEDGLVVVDKHLENMLVIQVVGTEGQGKLLDIAAWGRAWVESLARFAD